MIQDIQIQQINKGFKFLFEDKEVEVSNANYNNSVPLNTEISLHECATYKIVGTFTANMVINYLHGSNQLHLIDLERIMIGYRITQTLGILKETSGAYKGLYKTSTLLKNSGGKEAMSLYQIGDIVLDCVQKKTTIEWLDILDKKNKING